MFKICQKLGWDQVIRINGSYKVKTRSETTFIQLSLFDQGSYRQVIMGKHYPHPLVNLAVFFSEKSSEPLYLATSVNYQQSVTGYKQRMWIE